MRVNSFGTIFAKCFVCLITMTLLRNDCAVGGKVDGPLFLSPYIESGQLALGRAAAQCTPLKGNIKSYSGFLTVNKSYDSHLFFWFFPSTNSSAKDAPVVLWLQGGPGISSMYRVFFENGPYMLLMNGDLTLNPHSWSRNMNLLYIDNPVGVGFSFTNHPNGYATNDGEIGQHLYSAIVQFFKLFPSLQRRNFYMAGDSYAAKYILSLGTLVHANKLVSPVKIQLKGLALGNAWVDPVNMMNYSEYLFQHGIIGYAGKKQFEIKENEIRSFCKNNEYARAYDVFDIMLNAEFTPYPTLFNNATSLNDIFNYLRVHKPLDKTEVLNSFLNRKEVSTLLNAGRVPFFGFNKTVEYKLIGDIFQSAAKNLETLLDHYGVVLYTGQFDIICAYPLILNFVRKIKWNGVMSYQNADRFPWYVGEELAGYYKSGGNLTDILVRNAGHLVISDQPELALKLFNRFLLNTYY